MTEEQYRKYIFIFLINELGIDIENEEETEELFQNHTYFPNLETAFRAHCHTGYNVEYLRNEMVFIDTLEKVNALKEFYGNNIQFTDAGVFILE